MRLLFATSDTFHPESASTRSLSVYDSCRRLQTAGHEVAVLCGWQDRIRGRRMIRDDTPGLPVYRCVEPESVAVALTLTLGVDAIVVFGRAPAAMSDTVIGLDVPTAGWWFGGEARDLDDRPADAMPVPMAATGFVAVLMAAYCGVDVPVFEPAVLSAPGRDPAAPAGSTPTILYLDPRRDNGAERALALAANLPHYRFLFAEEESLDRAWRVRCYERALECGNVEWHRRAIDRVDLFARARVVLEPGVAEIGFSRAVVEAQYLGIPVLASDRGCLPASVADGGMVLALDEPVSAWCDALEMLLGEGGDAVAARARSCELGSRYRDGIDAAAERLVEFLAGLPGRVRAVRPTRF